MNILHIHSSLTGKLSSSNHFAAVVHDRWAPFSIDIVPLQSFSYNLFHFFAEGKCTATKYGCKFIETSVVLNHQIDVLLVGIVRQIRCRQRQTNETHEAKGKVTKAAKGFLARILKRHNKRAGSPCDKLFEL